MDCIYFLRKKKTFIHSFIHHSFISLGATPFRFILTVTITDGGVLNNNDQRSERKKFH